ncbi:galactose-1-phosphate uridylyltransferase [Methanocalculus alkaliphilus]|uniref:galactose-1-phosphate uridylyltransferase n=1 Tax=Methanocalculus alkaliphilus TaxID=768730 RepID=UPI00209E4613|nr:galactose-1-phosphate uridylyltransferase [Methanocalculus alkaliphilus]MCP1714236.1 galactose-1-phosphate uridylyltransferase [Methanocalculus alkaliphilus]
MPYFSEDVIRSNGATILYRREDATGISCRISPVRGVRDINPASSLLQYRDEVLDCPFCRSRIFSRTEPFDDGDWITRGESVTFPNLYPFADRHTVTVITRAHMVESFTREQISDALIASASSLESYLGYPSINWNFLPSAGASLLHPHLQGVADAFPTSLCRLYLTASKNSPSGNYWRTIRETEEGGPRHLFGDEILWYANPVPIGECEIRGLLPFREVSDLPHYADEIADGILRIIRLFHSFGSVAFNMGILFGKNGGVHDGMHAFCTLIARINPNPDSISDSAFMERIHREPVVMTLPEEIRTASLF